ncbi:MAG: nucleotidyl transferase AbiEii/AbiGii toxin family protein, partial [Alphaproteobacteria bacterium]|nr:nucleotidyl transferase AbiEii/AbiGii toxin family protein [Alphaproteobacteria bacterium]
MTSIPGWIDLLDAALTVIAEAERLAGRPIEWTLGGGTAIMVAHAHRLSRDVDLFLHEAQMLPMLSPRLNDGAAALTEVYGESASAVRLELGPGEIDFILAPDLTGLPAPPCLVHGRRVALQHPIE